MKKLFVLLFILTPLISYSQFKFPNDANFRYYHLDYFKDFDIKPNIEKSMSFELRLWVSTFTKLPVLLKLTYNNECIWKAEKYIVNENKNNEYKVIKSEILLPENWNELWDSLVVSNILTLPDNPTFKHKRIEKDDGIPVVDIAITDGTSYTVDLLSRENNRQYSITNPIGYYRFYKDSQPLKDFNRILEILSEVFKYKFE